MQGVTTGFWNQNSALKKALYANKAVKNTLYSHKEPFLVLNFGPENRQ